MDPALRAAASGMIAQQTRIEVISNNLSNVNTTSYKRRRAHFEDLLYQTEQAASNVDLENNQTQPEVQVGRGTRLSSVKRINSQGSIRQTGRPLDVAIEGDGFFQVRKGDGTVAYTRDGSFRISDQGTLVTTSGYEVLPGINVPRDASEIAISKTGVVTARTGGETSEPVEIGRIELARFPNATGLKALGENLYAETSNSGAPQLGMPDGQGFGQLRSGALEASNVEIVREMTNMISAMRAFEIGSKAVQSSQEMSQITSQMLR